MKDNEITVERYYHMTFNHMIFRDTMKEYRNLHPQRVDKVLQLAQQKYDKFTAAYNSLINNILSND